MLKDWTPYHTSIVFVEALKIGNYLVDQQLWVPFIAMPLGIYSALGAWSTLLHCSATGLRNSSGFWIKRLKKYHWTGIRLLVLETLQA